MSGLYDIGVAAPGKYVLVGLSLLAAPLVATPGVWGYFWLFAFGMFFVHFSFCA